MDKVVKELHDIGIVPVIAIDDADKAVPLAKALAAGGLPAAEVTFRTEAGEEAIKRIVKEVPEMVVGAGTVLTKDQADRAIAAGSKFIVSPGFNPEITKYVISKGVSMCPGTAAPGEMEQAMALGLDTVKFFPAEQNGGIAKLKALAGPYKTLNWMPTGGVNTDNLEQYASFDQIVAVGGTWMVKKDLINNEKWDEITEICRAAVKKLLGFRLLHLGINENESSAAEKTAKLLSDLFGFAYRPGNSSVFAGDGFEVMRAKGRGDYGHIAIGTWNVDRAMYHLGKQGVGFDESTRSTDSRGNTQNIYTDLDIAGFAVHLKKI
jgi:2-dehydro-3-deoxyphosphogluconate aldolase/(4S)-4-hydroxy-2-oxoglutarate aldolase